VAAIERETRAIGEINWLELEWPRLRPKRER
jgi:hypothetical protein